MKEDPAVYADGDVADDEALLMLEWLNIIEHVEAENKGDDDMRWWGVLAGRAGRSGRKSTTIPALLSGDVDVGGIETRADPNGRSPASMRTPPMTARVPRSRAYFDRHRRPGLRSRLSALSVTVTRCIGLR